jgi:wobble nucleotide-excising tRNase
MISSLTIKNVATYDNINGVTINDLKKVNFFFGFNGSGKSTISKYLRNLSLAAPKQSQKFNSCLNIGYDNSLHQILTFNEDFIEENFRRSADLKGVFSLNQANAAIDQQITDEEAAIQASEILQSKYQSKIDGLEANKRTKNDALLNHCWNQRTTFSTFSKISLIHSGSKPNHLQEIRRILQNQYEILTIQQLTEQYQTLYEQDLKEILLKINTLSYLTIRRTEVHLEKLLQEVIVGNEDVDIAALITALDSRNWVELGLNFLKPDDKTCPFCQNETIDTVMREQFEKYFDETYKNKLAEISKLRDRYQQESNNLIASITAIQNVFNPNNQVSNLVLLLTRFFDDKLGIIDHKIEHSNEKKFLTSISTLKNELSDVLDKIKTNNQLYKNLDANRQTHLKDIWNFMAEQCRTEMREYDERITKYSRIVGVATELKKKYSDKIVASKQNIENLRSQTVNTKDAIDNINLILKNAGFEGFEIAEKDKVNNISRYFLKRLNATTANPIFESLSEGEKNFISFLYFFQLCVGTDNLQNNSTKKKIIVIDDPVSSLDSQALFIVASLIHSLILRKGDNPKADKMLLKNTTIAQAFIFTHNIYFYKEVTFERRPICTDYWHYRISKQNNQTSITGDYNKSVFDDYSLMWKNIRDLKANIPNDSSLNIMISNSMRRIIESYVNFVGYGKDSWAALINENQNDPTYYVKYSFIATINDESHKVSALDNAYYQKIINEQPRTLFTTFASIFKSIGKEHYEMMMDEQL